MPDIDWENDDEATQRQKSQENIAQAMADEVRRVAGGGQPTLGTGFVYMSIGKSLEDAPGETSLTWGTMDGQDPHLTVGLARSLALHVDAWYQNTLRDAGPED